MLTGRTSCHTVPSCFNWWMTCDREGEVGLGGGQLVLRKQIEDTQKRRESSPVSLLYWLQYSCRHRPGCRSCELWKVSPAAPPSGHSTAPRSSGRLESKRDNFTAVVLKGFFSSTIFRALFFTPRLRLIMTLMRTLQRRQYYPASWIRAPGRQMWPRPCCIAAAGEL